MIEQTTKNSIVRLTLLCLTLMLLLSGCGKQGKVPIISLKLLGQSDVKIAVAMDSPQEPALLKDFPGVKVIPYLDVFTSYADVANGRIDACVYGRREMELAIEHGTRGVRLLEEDYASNIIAVGTSPVTGIPDLLERLNAFIAEIKADGTLDDMYRRWVTEGDGAMPDIPQAEAPSLTLRVGTTGTIMPYSYYEGTELTGYDIELARRFAAWLGAALELKVYDFGGIIPAAQSGDVDCIMANLYYTPEKNEAIPFSDPLFEVPIAVMVRDTSQLVESEAAEVYTSIEQLHGQNIGSITGTTYDDTVRRRLPDATFSYFNNYSDMVTALKAGKIAAFACDEPVLRNIITENSGVTMLPEPLETFEFAFIFGKDEEGTALRDQMSAFIRELRESGELARLDEKWLGGHMDEAEMPDIEALDGSNGTLTMALEALNPPFIYMRGNECVGYEIELAVRFCERYGYALNIASMTFDGILPAVQSGKADFGGSSVSITEERKESVNFSEGHFTGGTVLGVLSGGAASQGADEGFTALDELDGKRIGVQTGTTAETLARERLPHAEIEYFSTFPDMAAALTANKIDAFIGDSLVLTQMASEDPGIRLLDEKLNSYECGFVLAKNERGEALAAEIDPWLRDMRERGELERLLKKWTQSDESARTMPDYRSLPAPKGILTMTTEGTYPPMNYYRGDECVGMEVELCALFCEANGYGLNVTTMDFGPAMLMAVQTGKVDFAISGIAITEERKESVMFSEPYFTGGMTAAVRKGQGSALSAEPADEGGGSFWDGIVASFEKTFLREDRWQLFTKGILTTLAITIASILLGTALGFLIFMLCRNGNPVANLLTRFCFWLVQGMPMVVFLMILYYIIFGSIAINGILVAIIGFTITFGSSVYGLLKLGVGAVDAGQYEAAYALGYSNRRTFFRIILPQALPHVLPSYRGEIVGLIKATAVVGYITVQDLTKMGDIVRSRTYEAFFPLIAVTVIYFVLEGILKLLVRRMTLHYDPRRRKPEEILKGVKTDDQN